jgi:hypothetical protein
MRQVSLVVADCLRLPKGSAFFIPHARIVPSMVVTAE